MSDTKPRLTHMMIDAVNERVTDMKKMIITGIFLTLAFSAATFGLTLGAAEFSKESHVDGRAMVNNNGERMMMAAEPKTQMAAADLCQAESVEEIMAVLDAMTTIMVADEETGIIRSEQVLSYEVNTKEGTAIVKGSAGAEVDVLAMCTTEASNQKRHLLANFVGAPSGCSNGGGGSGSGAGSGQNWAQIGFDICTTFVKRTVIGMGSMFINPPGSGGRPCGEWGCSCVNYGGPGGIDYVCSCNDRPVTRCSDGRPCCGNNGKGNIPVHCSAAGTPCESHMPKV